LSFIIFVIFIKKPIYMELPFLFSEGWS